MVNDADNRSDMNRGDTNGGRRQRSIPLLASLLLNALLIGVLAAHWFHTSDERRGDYRLAPGLPSIHGLARELDEGARSDLRQRLGSQREAIRGAMRAAHASRRDVVAAMRAQPFDGDALATAFAVQRQSDMAVAAAIQSVLVAFASNHDATDREALLRAMSREHRDRGNARRGGERPTRSRPPQDTPAPAQD